MTGTIFDLIKPDIESLPQDQKGFFELAESAPQPKDNSFLGQVSDYAKTVLKGSVEGLGRLGRVMGPTRDLPKISDGKIDLGKSTGQQLEQQTENLDKLLPTDEGFVQTALRRGLREAPTAAAFPGSGLQAVPRSIAAGFLGESAKELGAPEWAQAAAELTAYIGPDVTKKLLASGKNKDIIEAGRKFGLTDEQITPLIQSDFKQKWLAKLSPKRGSTKKALENTKSALSESYNNIQNSELAGNLISSGGEGALKTAIEKGLFEMPSKVRSKITKDVKDLFEKPITGKSLINFYSDVNHNISGKTKQLSLLKAPIKKALMDVSPELAQDFDLINKLHTKYYPIASKLKPNIATDIVSAAETIGLLGSVVAGNTFTLGALITEKSAKKLAQQMLINPHFQQLSKKMVVALNQNKYGLAKKVTQDFLQEISKFDAGAAEKLAEISDEELEKFFNPKALAEQPT